MLEDTDHAGLRGSYQAPDSTMTLREGLAEYYRVNPGLSDPKNIRDPKSARYFRCHDTTHVIFGTSTTDLHEGVNDMWTFFAVDIRYVDYGIGFIATDESKAIAKTFTIVGLWHALWGALSLTPELWRRTRRLKRRWPWDPPEDHLDRTLVDLRADYGIEVFLPEELLAR